MPMPYACRREAIMQLQYSNADFSLLRLLARALYTYSLRRRRIHTLLLEPRK